MKILQGDFLSLYKWILVLYRRQSVIKNINTLVILLVYKMKTKYKENDVRGNCICGHNHICYVEDLGKYYDEEGFDLILECCECDCENFKEMRG